MSNVSLVGWLSQTGQDNTIDRPVLDIGHLSVFPWKASSHKSVRSTSAHGILARQVQAEAFAHWRGWRLVRCFSEAVINHKRWFMWHRFRVGWDLPAGSAAIRAGGEQGERVAHTGHWRLTVGESNSWLGSLPSAMIFARSWPVRPCRHRTNILNLQRPGVWALAIPLKNHPNMHHAAV